MLVRARGPKRLPYHCPSFDASEHPAVYFTRNPSCKFWDIDCDDIEGALSSSSRSFHHVECVERFCRIYKQSLTSRGDALAHRPPSASILSQHAYRETQSPRMGIPITTIVSPAQPWNQAFRSTQYDIVSRACLPCFCHLSILEALLIYIERCCLY